MIRANQHHQRGFTLLETLVALAILAIAMAAVIRTATLETGNVEKLRVRLLADWVAQNRLALHVARSDWPAVGMQEGEELQSGMHFAWREEVNATPNPAFRRIEVTVFLDEQRKQPLRSLSGYLAQYPQR